MQRKSTKREPPSPRLKARARAIINGEKYDHDTRESIRYMLKTNAEDLATWVRDAEKGVTICDTFMSLAHRREGVRQVVKLLNSGRGVVPLWFLEAVNSALVAVAQAEGIDTAFINRSPHGLWEGVNPGANKLITKLFDSTPAVLDREFTFAPVRTEQERVSDAVSEIFSNPRTPADLYEKVAEFIVETVNERGEVNERGAKDSLIYSRAMVPVIIAAHPEDELQGAIETAQAAKEAQS